MTTPQTPVPGLPVPRAVGGQLLLAHYRNTQQSIAQRAAIAIQNLWMRMIDPTHFADTWKNYNPVVNGIIDTHHKMTAANAAEYYANSRVFAGYAHFPVPGVTLDPAYLDKETNTMGAGMFFHYLKDNPDPIVASNMARDGLRGTGVRLIMSGGRDTVTKAAQNDPRAQGWERVIEPGACGFCAMLAGRGAVYKESTVDFRAHDHCHCVARAVFDGQESVNKGIQDQWATATKGTRGKAAIAAWNKHWEAQGGSVRSENAGESPGQRPGHAAIHQESVRQPALSH